MGEHLTEIQVLGWGFYRIASGDRLGQFLLGAGWSNQIHQDSGSITPFTFRLTLPSSPGHLLLLSREG